MKRIVCFLVCSILVSVAAAENLRIGLIGLDTSHVEAFTGLINDPRAEGPLSEAKIVAAFRGGSLDIPSSADRIDKFTETLTQQHGVKLYDSIAEMCHHVDAVMLESVDGRPHLRQAIPVIEAGKPLFIDKPMAGSLGDVIMIFELASKKGVPVFSASSLRYGIDSQAVRHGSIGAVTYAETYSPCSLEVHHPDLFWYGVHGVESLFTVMGPGCESVVRRTTDEGRIEVVGTWKGGRTGIFREGKGYGGNAKGLKGESTVGSYDSYKPLVVEAVKMFQTGKVPVSPAETIELFAFMEAADESGRRDGQPVKIREMIERARQ